MKIEEYIVTFDFKFIANAQKMVLTDLSLLVNCAIRLAVIKIEFRLGLLALLIEEGQVVD